jgi:hypothetical protein
MVNPPQIGSCRAAGSRRARRRGTGSCRGTPTSGAVRPLQTVAAPVRSVTTAA